MAKRIKNPSPKIAAWTAKETPSRVFEERKIELERSKNMWRNLFLLSVFLLLFVTLSAFVAFMANMGFTAVLWLELVLGLPLIYSAIFFHAQHNRERDYLEEYSFKSILARSLEAYRTILKGDINPERPEEQKKFLDFIIDSVKNLHTPPRAIISKHPVKNEEDIKVGVVEKLADVFKRFIPGK